MHNVTPSIRHNTSTSSCISIMLLPKSLRLSTSSRLTTGCIDHQLNSATSNSTLHYRHTLRTLPSLGMDLSCYTGENTRWSIYQMKPASLSTTNLRDDQAPLFSWAAIHDLSGEGTTSWHFDKTKLFTMTETKRRLTGLVLSSNPVQITPLDQKGAKTKLRSKHRYKWAELVLPMN